MLLRILLTLCCCASLAAGQVVISHAPAADLSNRDTQAITVAAGATSLIAMAADPSTNGGDIFDVVSSNPAVVMTLVLPNDTEITAGNAATQGFSYTVVPQGIFANGPIPSPLAVPGAHTLIQLPPGLASGTYRVKANATGVTTSTLVIATYCAPGNFCPKCCPDICVSLHNTQTVTRFFGPATWTHSFIVPTFLPAQCPHASTHHGSPSVQSGAKQRIRSSRDAVHGSASPILLLKNLVAFPRQGCEDGCRYSF